MHKKLTAIILSVLMSVVIMMSGCGAEKELESTSLTVESLIDETNSPTEISQTDSQIQQTESETEIGEESASGNVETTDAVEETQKLPQTDATVATEHEENGEEPKLGIGGSGNDPDL